MLLAGPNVPTPLYPTYERVFGFSPFVLTLIFAVYALVQVPALLVFGQLSDAIGRRRVLLPAIAIAALGSVLFAIGSNLVWFFAARAAQGAALGAGLGTATAALTETDPEANHTRAALVGSFTVVGGIAFGPLLGGLLAQYAPAPLMLPYLVHTALLAVAFAAMVHYLPGNLRTKVRWQPTRPSVPSEIRRPFALAGVSTFLAFSVSALFLTLMPTYIASIAGSHNLALLGSVVALMLGCAALAQLGLGVLPTQCVQPVGLALLAAGLAGIIAAAHTRSLIVALGATIVTGLGLGLAFGGSLAAVNSVAPGHRRGDILSSYYVIVYIGLAVPIIGVGLIALATGQLVAVQIFAYAIIAGCLAGIAAHQLDGRRSNQLAGRSPDDNGDR
jgi:MFS family permease